MGWNWADGRRVARRIEQSIELSHQDWRKTQRWVLPLGFVLAALLTPPGVMQAEAPASVKVFKDRFDNINVTVTPNLIPHVRRSLAEGITVIDLPESALKNGMPSIDPALKNANLVEIKPHGKGKQIVIKSDQIFMGIQEAALSSTSPSNAPDKAKDSHTEDNKPVEKDKSSSKPTASAEPGTKPVTMMAVTSPPAKNTAAKSPVAETDKTKAAKLGQATLQGDQLREPQTPAKATATDPDDIPLEQVLKDVAKPESATEEPAQRKSSALDDAVSLSEPLTEEESTALLMADSPSTISEEQIPIDTLQRQHKVSEVTSQGTLLRMAGSLLLVVLMLVAFLKMGLPALIRRYPAFFERLKQQRSGNSVAFGAGLDTLLREQVKQKASQDPKGQLLPLTVVKKDYLEKLHADENRFQVLTSAKLDRDKELHLVEIKGRHLVIATTPYSVNLITEFTDEPDSDNPLAGPPQVSTEAYLESASGEGYDQSEPQNATFENEREIYKKYLPESAQGSSQHLPPQNPVDESQREQAKAQHREIRSALKHQRHDEQHMVDAEEVIVLQDYDDVYRP